MAREKYIKTKKDCIYYYKDSKGKKKYAFRFKYYHNGKRPEKSERGFNSIEDCERALIKVKSQILNDNHEILKNDTMTVKALMENFVAAKQNSWKPTTFKSSTNAINRHINPHIGNMKLKQVTNGVLQTNIVDPMITAGYKATSIESMYRTLNSAFNYAIAEEWLDRKRFTSVNLKRAEPKKKRQPLSVLDLEKLLLISKENSSIQQYTAIMILALTGMRKGELFALTTKDIDFDNKTISITKTRDSLGTRSPKTLNSIRTIPLTDELAKCIKKYLLWFEPVMWYNRDANPEKHLIVHPNGMPVARDYINRALTRLCTEYKLPHISPHYLRHTYASILAAQNTPFPTIAALLGDTVETVTSTYAHSFENEEILASKMLNDLIRVN